MKSKVFYLIALVPGIFVILDILLSVIPTIGQPITYYKDLPETVSLLGLSFRTHCILVAITFLLAVIGFIKNLKEDIED